MKKYILALLIIIITMPSCEKEDFCAQEVVTPNLVLKFINSSDTSKIKQPDSLYVWAKAKDSLYKNVKVDSILLPLNTLSNTTTYNLAVGKDSISQLTIQYNTKEEYVSRACGYRIIFNDIKITNNNKMAKSWINSLSTKSIKIINNQTNAHVKIYH